ncbi:MAG: ABC transporter ATP-binding protein [Desulfovibrionaceae bacterium]
MLNMLQYFLATLNPCHKKQWWWFLALVVLTALFELVALGLVALFITSLTALDQVMLSRYAAYGKQMFGEALFSDPQLFYLTLGSATIIMMVLKNALLGLQYYVTTRFEGTMSTDAGTRMLRWFLECPYEWSSRQNPADVHSHVQWRLFVGYLPSNLIQVFSDGVISLLLLGSLFFFEPLLSLCVFLGLGSVGGGFFLLCKNKISDYGSTSRNLNFSNSRECLRNIQGMRELKAFNAVSSSLSLFGLQLHKWARCAAMQKVLERAPVWILESVGIFGIIGGSVIMICHTEYSSARIMGTLSLVAISAWRILPSISRSVGMLGSISGYLPNLHKVRDFIETMREQLAKTAAIIPEPLPLLEKEIDLHEVEYAYPGSSRKALNGVSLRILRGEMVGIIGHSGAGKSTLADILAGFIEPTGGRVRIDDNELDAKTASSWRDQLGIVPQHPYFFEGSLRSNIALTFSDDAIDHERLTKSCELAGVDEFQNDLPDGLDSAMGERGARLSGGQMQRVAIARALYRDPPVLLFDEATSSLDDANEELVRETILGLRGKRTIIIIAHRLRTVEQCDKLLWLRQGRVAGCGAPEDILSRYAQAEKAEEQTDESKRDEKQ